MLFLSLPILHNVYYADSWQWFPRFVGGLENMIIPDSTGIVLKDLFISLYRTSLHYLLGVDLIFHNTRQNIFGITFIPAGVVMIFLMYRKMKGNLKWLFLLQIVFVVGPTLIVNWAYFPRFEFINLYCLFISSLVFLNYSKSFPVPNHNYLHKLQ